MTVQASDANTERVFSKGFAGTSWNGTRQGRELAAGGKEGLQESGRVLGQEAGGDFDLVIQLGAGKKLEAGTEGAALGVVGGVDEAGNPSLNDRTSTHGAGLEVT